ncbi:MAG: leucine-rich repeat protein [Prevotella sp.]|nr:leucine-rich repeat protein [Prevotella sp.]
MKNLILLFMLMLLPVMDSAADPVMIDLIYYNLDSSTKEAEVTNYWGGYPDGMSVRYSGSVTIPESVFYDGTTYNVTTIGKYAFFYGLVTSVTIPNSVTSINDYAFFRCKNLNSITIPNSVKTIGSSAFNGCTGLTSVTIPKSVTSIGNDNPFGGCSGLTSIKVESGNTYFDSRNSCNAIIKKQNSELISGCMNTVIPYGVKSIGSYAFLNCSGLTSITIPNSVTSIGTAAFYGCSGLTSVTIPNSVTSIGSYTFYNCSNLASVTSLIVDPFEIPENVFYDENDNFIIATLIVLKGAKEKYEATPAWNKFEWIDELETVEINGIYYNLYPDEAEVTNSQGGSKKGGGSYSGNVAIPSTVYYGGTRFSVTSIGEYAFYNCSDQTSVTIPNSVKSIKHAAFYECSGLTSVNIPSSVTTIEDYAIFACSGLTSLTIPNSVTSIGNSAFSNCTGLTSISIPNSVTSLGGHVFRECTGLTSVAIPNSLTTIGEYTFYNCRGLTSIEIPDNVTSIEDYAFYGCRGLTSITIPDNVTYLGKGVFTYCRGLTSITIPNSLTSISNASFSGCSGLTSVTIPNSVTSIGRSVFSDCTSLASITIPNSVTSIGELAFAYSGLTSITIPASVTSIAPNAFKNCSSLTSVTSLITDPFEINENVFSNNGSFTTATLYVPRGTKEKYEATSAWNKFQTIVETWLKGDVNGDGAVDVADIAAIIDVMAKGTYDPEADVNEDKTVDVADIATIIDIMAGKDVDTPEENTDTACSDANHPHWIDLGLPSGTKWACCNVGASKPEDYGDHYIFYDALDYDAPSMDQIEELLNNTTSEWTTQNGVNGYKFTGTNGCSVFLPAAGHFVNGMQLDNVGTYGDYWSCTLTSDGYPYGFRLLFDSGGARLWYDDCYNHAFVRSVR